MHLHRGHGKKVLSTMIPLDMLPVEYGGQGLTVASLTGTFYFPFKFIQYFMFRLVYFFFLIRWMEEPRDRQSRLVYESQRSRTIFSALTEVKESNLLFTPFFFTKKSYVSSICLLLVPYKQGKPKILHFRHFCWRTNLISFHTYQKMHFHIQFENYT